MANWKHRLQLKDLFIEDDDAATIRRVAQTVHARLEAFRQQHYPDDADLESIADEFACIAEDPDLRAFNWQMDELYDWGDSGRRLWIE